MHRTEIFIVLDTGQIEPLPHAQYVELLRGQLTMPEYAGQTVRLADWYVEISDGRPVSVLNETYSLLDFDAGGKVRWRHEQYGARANREFYDALTKSAYSDPDEDPAVQKLRKEFKSEYTWRPSDAERSVLHTLVFASPWPGRSAR